MPVTGIQHRFSPPCTVSSQRQQMLLFQVMTIITTIHSDLNMHPKLAGPVRFRTQPPPSVFCICQYTAMAPASSDRSGLDSSVASVYRICVPSCGQSG